MIVHSTCHQDNITIFTDKQSIAELSKLPIEVIEGMEGLEGCIYYFNRIKVLRHHEGTGEGKLLMIEVCRYADDLNAIIYNEPNPYGKRNLDSLIRFFKQSGFEMYGPHAMIRRPNMKPYIIEEKYMIDHKQYPEKYRTYCK